MSSWKLVILFMHIQLGLCDVTHPKIAALHSFEISFMQTSVTFLFFIQL